MKRSEALKVIGIIIDRDESYLLSNKEISLNILNELENLGIQPPKYLKEYKPLPSKIAHVEITEWEPEDDQ